MNPPIYLLEAAEDELVAAFEWYLSQSERAAAHFLDEMARTMHRVQTSPQEFPRLVGAARRALLNRFPYGVVFREAPRGIEIIAVAHAKRRPYYWRKRIAD